MKRTQRLVRLMPVVLLVASLALPIAAPVVAQGGDACPALVLAAVEAADAFCRETGRNQACYGHTLVEATSLDGARDASFRQPGDIREVVTLQAIQTAPLDAASGQWGIALMRIQASLPDTLPGQNVTIVLFGDALLSGEAGAEAPSTPIAVTATGSVNLRAGPSTTHAIVGTLAAGESTLADGRLAGGAWLRLQSGAWVYAPLVTAEVDVSALPIVAGEEVTYGPMQAFTFRTGLGDAACAEAPESGILIQTPSGAGQITLMFNGIEIQLGSTVALQGGAPDGGLILAQLEGTGMLPGYDGTLLGGQTWSFDSLDGVWTPVGDPQPLDARRYASLPVDLLPRPVPIYERHVVPSGTYGIVTRYFPPPPDVPAIGQSALLVHGRGLDWASWLWLIPTLQAMGWGVVVPDMPGHGETGGEPAYGDWAGILGDLAGFARDLGYGTGVIVGSSIGANAGLVACAGLADWCRGAALLSPGIDYFGVQALPAMPGMGGRPALIIASEQDDRGGPGDVARQVAAAGDNVTLQIYDGNLHGTDLAGQYDLLAPVGAWLEAFPGMEGG